MKEEMRAAKGFVERAEKEIGELPVVVKMIAMVEFAKGFEKANVGDTVMLHISNPKTRMLYKESIGCF